MEGSSDRTVTRSVKRRQELKGPKTFVIPNWKVRVESIVGETYQSGLIGRVRLDWT